MNRSRHGRTLAAIVAALFVPRVLLALVLIPPWQHPDEPQNIVLIRLLKENQGRRSTAELITRFRAGMRDDPVTEPLIVGSMAEHGWWTHYGRPTPEPPPVAFTAPADVVKSDFGLPGGGTTYFAASAAAFRVFGIDDPLQQMHALRAFSALLGALTIVAAALGARLLFGDTIALAVAALLALHPQFLLTSTAANPDAVVNAFGSLAWYLTARLFTGAGLVTAAAVIAAALAGGLVKRVGFPVLASAAVALSMWLVSRSRRQALLAMVVVALTAAAIAGVLATAMPEEWARLLASTSFIDERWSVGFSGDTMARLRTFTAGLFASAWLHAGWLRYPAPAAAMALWVAVLIVAIWGTASVWARADTGRRAGLGIAFVYVSVQLVATYAVHFPVGSGAQGRYLFPAIGPFAALLCVGWAGASTPQDGSRRLATLMLIALGFDVLAWVAVLLPAYAAG